MKFVLLIKISAQPEAFYSPGNSTNIRDFSEQVGLVYVGCEVLLHRAATTSDKYLNDGKSGYDLIEIRSDNLSLIEQDTGHIIRLLNEFTINPKPVFQALLARSFNPSSPSSPARQCKTSYFVEYAGTADNSTSWVNHYIDSHVSIMERLPGIQDILVYSPFDWRCSPEVERFESLLCNRVSFNSSDALDAALNSPVRDEMRKDYEEMPAFDGICTHFAMTTYLL